MNLDLRSPSGAYDLSATATRLVWSLKFCLEALSGLIGHLTPDASNLDRRFPKQRK